MKERAAHHGTFVVKQTYEAAVPKVFDAWARPEKKKRWFACHDEWVVTQFELDFRVGGAERLKTGPAGGTVHAFDGRYLDIVPNERIIYAYDMHLDQTRISVSLTTVEFKSVGTGTQLVFTEQVVFLDDYHDLEGRKEGTEIGLENLAKELAR